MKAYIIETAGVQKNIKTILTRAGDIPVYGVIKADGYGLGMLWLAEQLQQNGVCRFAVTEPADAVKLRGAGFLDEEILVLRSTACRDDARAVIEAAAVATVGSNDAATILNEIALEQGASADVHLKIDTGMGRYGFLSKQLEQIESVFNLPAINIKGIYTHFHSAFVNEKSARKQLEGLNGVAAHLREKGYDPGPTHAANSSFFFRFGAAGHDALRIGSALTGRLPFHAAAELTRIGYAQCEIAEIKWLPKGHTVGYGGAFKTKRSTKIAVIPLGHADGFCVEKIRDVFRLRDHMRYLFHDMKDLFLRKPITVTINGQKAPVLGHVGLAHTVADITQIECVPGDMARFEISPLYASAALERRYI